MTASTNRTGVVLIVLLIATNLASLGFLWYDHLRPGVPDQSGDTPGDPEAYFIEQVGLDSQQAEAVRRLRGDHFRRSDSLRREIDRQNRALRDELFAPRPDSARVEQITDSIGSLHAQHERLVFAHFEAIRNLCNPDQQQALARLLREADQRARDRHPPGRPEHRPPAPGGP